MYYKLTMTILKASSDEEFEMDFFYSECFKLWVQEIKSKEMKWRLALAFYDKIKRADSNLL